MCCCRQKQARRTNKLAVLKQLSSIMAEYSSGPELSDHDTDADQSPSTQAAPPSLSLHRASASERPAQPQQAHASDSTSLRPHAASAQWAQHAQTNAVGQQRHRLPADTQVPPKQVLPPPTCSVSPTCAKLFLHLVAAASLHLESLIAAPVAAPRVLQVLQQHYMPVQPVQRCAAGSQQQASASPSGSVQSTRSHAAPNAA